VLVRPARATLDAVANDTYTVERSATIDAPPKRIYDQIIDFHKWSAWSPWEDLDPNLARTYSGAEAGPGAVYDWSGNRKAGKGRMSITEASEPSRVRIDLVFEKPWKARNDTVFTGTKSLVTSIMGLFKSMDSFLGPDFEKGLARLKTVAESSTPGQG
jgi:hypothetical protein